jgi:ribosomal protein S18 acetylase RimI-like enzyme
MGYGKKLLENIDNYLNNLINKPIQVNLFSNNPIAIYLYEKIGFKYSGLKILRE